jgi:ribosomal protein L36
MKERVVTRGPRVDTKSKPRVPAPACQASGLAPWIQILGLLAPTSPIQRHQLSSDITSTPSLRVARYVPQSFPFRQLYRSCSSRRSRAITTMFLAAVRFLFSPSSVLGASHVSRSSLSLLTSSHTRGMKTRSSVKRLCDACKPVRRKNRVYIIW